MKQRKRRVSDTSLASTHFSSGLFSISNFNCGLGQTRVLRIILLVIVVCVGEGVRILSDESFESEAFESEQRKLLQDTLDFVHPSCGWTSTIKDLPYIASIQLRNPVGTAYWHQCGGIQLTNRAVLTLASCVQPFRDQQDPNFLNHTGVLIKNMYVSISPNCRHQKGRARIQLSRYFLNPLFNIQTPINYDIAIVELINEDKSGLEGEDGLLVSYSSDTDPQYPSWDEIYQRNLTVVGYGQDNFPEQMDTLTSEYFTRMIPNQQESVRLYGTEQCEANLAQFNISIDLETVTCGRMLIGDLCQGDAGSPAIYGDSEGRRAVIGLFASAVPKTCGDYSGEPMLFTNISISQQWISETLEFIHQDDPKWVPQPPIQPPTIDPPEDYTDSFPIVVIIIPIIVVLLLVLVMRWCCLRRDRGQKYNREQFYGSYVSDYTSHHLAVRVDDDDTNAMKTFSEAFTSAFQQPTESGAFSLAGRRFSQIEEDRAPLLLNIYANTPLVSLNSISYPADIALITSHLHSLALQGKISDGDVRKLLTFKTDIILRSRPQENSVLAHLPTSTQLNRSTTQPESRNDAYIQLSDMLVRSTVQQAHIRNVQSNMYNSLLQSLGQRRATSDSISEASDLLFPQAAFGFLKDIGGGDVGVGVVQTETQQQDSQSRQQQQLQQKNNGRQQEEGLRRDRSEDTLQKLKWELNEVGLFIDISRDVMLKRRLGGGSFGFVYEGTWTLPKGEQRQVAIKIMKTGHADSPSWQLYAKQFMSEINMMASIRSDYVVRLYGGSITRDELAIIMELMEGGSLDHHIRRRHKGNPLPYQETLIIGMQIAKGLSELHPSVVHRDLKPQNILLNVKGDVKIADLGLSKMKQSTYMTASEMKGTPAYIAPEVFGGKDVSEKCDIYALGMILWECVTGDKPWGQYQHPAQIMHEVMLRHHRPPIPKSCPEAVRSVIEKCWEQEPYRRLSAYEVGIRLQRELERLEGQQLPQHLNLFPQATRTASGERGVGGVLGFLKSLQMQRQMSRDDSAQGNQSRQNSQPLYQKDIQKPPMRVELGSAGLQNKAQVVNNDNHQLQNNIDMANNHGTIPINVQEIRAATS